MLVETRGGRLLIVNGAALTAINHHNLIDPAATVVAAVVC